MRKIVYSVHPAALFGALRDADLVGVDQFGSVAAYARLLRSALAVALPTADITVRVVPGADARPLRAADVAGTATDDGAALAERVERIAERVCEDRVGEWMVDA